jgi:hypothetical protein
MRSVERLRHCGRVDFALTHNNDILVDGSDRLDEVVSTHSQQLVRVKRCLHRALTQRATDRGCSCRQHCLRQ